MSYRYIFCVYTVFGYRKLDLPFLLCSKNLAIDTIHHRGIKRRKVYKCGFLGVISNGIADYTYRNLLMSGYVWLCLPNCNWRHTISKVSVTEPFLLPVLNGD